MNRQVLEENRKVINTILKQKGNFTEQDIITALSSSISSNKLAYIVREKLKAMCEVNLIKDTVFYYYVR